MNDIKKKPEVRFGCSYAVNTEALEHAVDPAMMADRQKEAALSTLGQQIGEAKGESMWQRTENSTLSRVEYVGRLYVFTPAELKAYLDAYTNRVIGGPSDD